MSNFTKFKLTGSTNGRPIKIVATGTPGTLIHTADAIALDELWLYANGTSAPTLQLTVELGGVTVPDDLIEDSILGKQGPKLVIPGIPLTGGVVIRAFAETTLVINVTGWVNRIG